MNDNKNILEEFAISELEDRVEFGLCGGGGGDGGGGDGNNPTCKPGFEVCIEE